MGLFLINLVGIYFTALLFFKIKGIDSDFISMKKQATWQDPEANLASQFNERERLVLDVDDRLDDHVSFH